MMSATPPRSRAPFGIDPAALGIACCVISALGYTGSNICLRQLAGDEVSYIMTICVKELVAVAVVGPWLIGEWLRGKRLFPGLPTLGLLVVVGLAVQLVGNVGQQFAFGTVGLAVTVPIVLCLMLTTAPLLGRVVLKERVSHRTVGALALLIASILALSIGAGQDAETTAQPARWLAAWAVLAASAAGVTYATLTVTIRSTVTRGVPQMVVVFVTTGVGALSLGLLSLREAGLDPWRTLPAHHLTWMLASGALNLIAFVAITKGLQLTSVVNVNLLNASQVAMAAVAGVVLFGEPNTFWLRVGVAMTIAGMILIDRRLPAAEA